VAESSFDAWTKFYKQDENAPNAIVSYYAKGALAALAIDLTIRRESGGRKSLDDCMRALWNDFGKTGTGADGEAIEALMEQVSGIGLRPLFDQALRGTDDLPLEQLFSAVGVGFQLRGAEGEGDKGGKPAQGESPGRPDLGVRLAADTPEARLQFVFDGRPAMQAGLSAGDTLLALDGVRVDRAGLDARLERYRPGDRVAVHAFRRDELLHLEVTLGAAPEDTCYLTLDEAGEAPLKLRQGWLAG
jgi:predicted metalloprotease with PDZ domain